MTETPAPAPAPAAASSASASPQARIETAVQSALKAGDKERLQTMRMLLTEIKNERIRRGGEVDEAGFAGLVRKAIKQREEAATQFRAGRREELAAKEEAEAVILTALLPAAADEGEIRAAMAALIAERGLAGPAAIGALMKEMLPRFGTTAGGATLNRIARELLGAAGAPR
jgi:uncharacterized protein YqeY